MALARWPSGLRRQTKDPGHLMTTTVYLVRKGVGSNPTLVTFFFLPKSVEMQSFIILS